MLQHFSRDPLPARSRGSGKAAIANMRAAAKLVGADVISAKDLAVVSGNISCVVTAQPVRQRLFTENIRWLGIGVASPEDRFKDLPDGIVVFGC